MDTSVPTIGTSDRGKRTTIERFRSRTHINNVPLPNYTARNLNSPVAGCWWAMRVSATPYFAPGTSTLSTTSSLAASKTCVSSPAKNSAISKMQQKTLRCCAWPACTLVLLIFSSLLLPSSAVNAEVGGSARWEESGELNQPLFHNLRRQALSVVEDHPRLFASGEQWDSLESQISNNSYLQKWNETIIDRASQLYDEAPIPYPDDCDVSVGCTLEVARYTQDRVKHWAYAYLLTKDNKWVNRTWEELQHVAGNGTEYFGRPGDNWNSR